MRPLLAFGLALSAAACSPVSDYRPNVDLAGVDAARYETDLRDCKSVAEGARYAPVAVAALQGAALGLALGAVGGWLAAGSAPAAADSWTLSEGYGAAAGFGAGTAFGASQVKPKPDERARVDRCLRNNGYRIMG